MYKLKNYMYETVGDFKGDLVYSREIIFKEGSPVVESDKVETISFTILSQLRVLCPFLYVYYTQSIEAPTSKGTGISQSEFIKQVIDSSEGLYSHTDVILESHINLPYYAKPESIKYEFISDTKGDECRKSIISLHINGSLEEVLKKWVLIALPHDRDSGVNFKFQTNKLGV